MLLELASIGLIIPLLASFLSDSALTDMAFLGMTSSSLTSLQLSAVAVTVWWTVIFVKFLFNFYALNYQNKFVYFAGNHLSSLLFSSYLQKPYEFFVDRHSSGLMLNMTSELNYVSSLVQATLIFLAETVMVVGLAIFMFWMNPLIFIVIVTLLAVLSMALVASLKNRTKLWGNQRDSLEKSRNKLLSESFLGIKELVVAGGRRIVMSRLADLNATLADISVRHQVAQQIPRYLLELVVALMILIIFFIEATLRGRSSQEIVVLLGVVAIIGLRLIPAFNRIIFTYQTFQFTAPVIDRYLRDIGPDSFCTKCNKDRDIKNKWRFQSEILFKGVSFKYLGAVSPVLSNINLCIKSGERLGVQGVSGSGKTTLLSLLLGVLRPTQGSVHVDGAPVQSMLELWHQQLGYVSQSTFLYDDSIARNVAFGQDPRKIDYERIHRAITAVKLEELIFSLPLGVETHVGELGSRLSGGQRQRLGIARALYKDPQLLVLDEITSGLDEKTEADIIRMLRSLRSEMTIVVVSHRPSIFELCDRIISVENGEIKYNKN